MRRGRRLFGRRRSEAEVRAAIGSLPIFQAGMLEVVLVTPLEPYPGFGAV